MGRIPENMMKTATRAGNKIVKGKKRGKSILIKEERRKTMGDLNEFVKIQIDRVLN